MIKVELQEYMGSDRSIAEAAWTSSTTHQGIERKTDEQVASLVERLAIEGHATPFESVVLRFWIKLPIQTDRQHITHRIASHNGMSGRYRTMPNEFFSIPQDVFDIMYRVNPLHTMQDYDKLCSSANAWYSSFIQELKNLEKSSKLANNEFKRLREFFRGVLPQNNMTERITTMNLRSFANYQKLRNNLNAQPEIQQVAKLMLEQVKQKNICPVAIEWLEKNNWEL